MKDQFAFDLKVNRKKSGLSQADSAHLLGRERSWISKLERGACEPSLEDLIALSIIHARTTDSLLSPLVGKVRQDLGERLATLQHPDIFWMHTFNRQNTLSVLGAHLSINSDQGHDSA